MRQIGWVKCTVVNMPLITGYVYRCTNSDSFSGLCVSEGEYVCTYRNGGSTKRRHDGGRVRMLLFLMRELTTCIIRACNTQTLNYS